MSTQQKKKKKNNSRLYILIAAVVLLIVMIVLGGMGTVVGPVAGAVALLVLEDALAGWTQHWMVILGPAIVLIVLTAKKGIYGFLADFDARRGGGTSS